MADDKVQSLEEWRAENERRILSTAEYKNDADPPTDKGKKKILEMWLKEVYEPTVAALAALKSAAFINLFIFIKML